MFNFLKSRQKNWRVCIQPISSVVFIYLFINSSKFSKEARLKLQICSDVAWFLLEITFPHIAIALHHSKLFIIVG